MNKNPLVERDTIHISGSGSVAMESVFHHNFGTKATAAADHTEIVLYFSLLLKTPAFQREISFTSIKIKAAQHLTPIILHSFHCHKDNVQATG